MFGNLTLAQRLLAINGFLMAALVATAIAVWTMMGGLSVSADRINTVNVPQLQRIAELELNVTRVSLQLRHAILARDAAERAAALADIGTRRQLLDRELAAFGAAMQDEAGRQAFAPLPGLAKAFWQTGERNIALIQEGNSAAAFAFLVDQTIPARNALLAPLAQEKARQGQLLTDGVRMGDYRPDDTEEEVDIRVRYPEEYRGLEQIEKITGIDVKPLIKEVIGAYSREHAGVHLHLYGKGDARPGRKMGHVTVTGTDWSAVEATAHQLRALLGLPPR